MPDANLIFKFINDLLNVAGSTHTVINNELIMAQCQVNIPANFFRPARTEIINLQLIVQPDLINKYPGAELVSQGSYRLQWLVEGIKQRGLIFKGTFPYELDPRRTQREIKNLLQHSVAFFFEHPVLSYQPHLMVNFKVCQETDERFEELYNLEINLVTGKIGSDLLAKLSGKKLSTTLPKHSEKRHIAYSEGFQTLLNHLRWLLNNQDPDWVEQAKERWQAEVEYLEDYYHDNQGAETADEPSFYRRMAEVYRKFRPVIKISIVNLAILYLPVVRYTVSALDDSESLPPILYEPLQQNLYWPVGASLDHQNDIG